MVIVAIMSVTLPYLVISGPPRSRQMRPNPREVRSGISLLIQVGAEGRLEGTARDNSH